MKSLKDFHNYQLHAKDHVLNNPYCGLFMEMGCGKTVVTLTAIKQLMYEDFEINKVLVVAPKNVALTVWSDEVKEWSHLKHIRVSTMVGTESQRLAAFYAKADVYVINRENVAWLISTVGSDFNFDMLVIDELSSFKNHEAKRFKALKIVRPRIKRVVGLTGTPVGNGLIDLWAEMFLIDRGERLGKNITDFRMTYFSPEKVNGYVVYSYAIKKNMDKVLYKKISDICISMKQKDYVELPEKIEKIIKVQFDDQTMKKYEEFEESQVLKIIQENSLRVNEYGELEGDIVDGNNISAINAAALTNKLLQFCNGAVYDENKKWHKIHDYKLDALDEILDTVQGQNVLVFYSYRSDLERIQQKYKYARVLKGKKDIQDWNDGKIKLLVAHPASAGHGLNLQAGGHVIVWFGLPWSLEQFLQANARLHRQGQKMSVVIYILLVPGTMDAEVKRALNRKEKGQDTLMDAVKAVITKYL